MIAAIARGDSVDADFLSKLHFEILNLLHEAGIHPISGSADGHETERSLQRTIAAQSLEPPLSYSIPHSIPACCIKLSIPMIHGHPSISVQDIKHGGKTGRSQLLTGARILVCGDSPIYYEQLYTFAMNPLAPLFHRDVVNTDKQDDRAAARTLSARALEIHLQVAPKHHALSIYLFIIGELVDAWQNRSINHIERAKMAMRARFFLMAWRSHIVQHPDYSVEIQFISRGSYDIFLTSCDSLLSLIITYRKFHSLYPLLPWLHSTEPVEHLFGCLRTIKPDVTYADALQAECKLRTLMLGDFGQLSEEERANETAAGYHHTYFDAPDLDVENLRRYPTDAELQNASTAAYEEAKQLLSVVNIDAAQMLKLYTPPEPSKRSKKACMTRDDPPQTVAELMRLFMNSASLSEKEQNEAEVCEAALAADSVNSSLDM